MQSHSPSAAKHAKPVAASHPFQLNFYVELILTVSLSVGAILLAQKYYPFNIWAAVAALVLANVAIGLIGRYVSVSQTPSSSVVAPIAVGLASLTPFFFLYREFGFLKALVIPLIAGGINMLIRYV